MQNAHIGDVEVDIGGKKYRLRYDWKAISEVQAQFGTGNISSLFSQASPDFVAGMLLIGLRRHHPDLTKEQLFEASPPISDTLKKIDLALNIAMFGPKTAPAGAAAGDSETKKKTSSRRG